MTTFIEYSNDVLDVFKNIEECNPEKKRKALIAFDDLIVVMIINRKLNSIVTEVLITGRKLKKQAKTIEDQEKTNKSNSR